MIFTIRTWAAWSNGKYVAVGLFGTFALSWATIVVLAGLYLKGTHRMSSIVLYHSITHIFSILNYRSSTTSSSFDRLHSLIRWFLLESVIHHHRFFRYSSVYLSNFVHHNKLMSPTVMLGLMAIQAVSVCKISFFLFHLDFFQRFGLLLL